MLGVLKADATRTRQVVEFTVSSVANYAWVLRYHASFVDSTGRIVFDMSAFGFEAHHSGRDDAMRLKLSGVVSDYTAS